MSKKVRITDEDCFAFSVKPNKIQNKPTKKTNLHHGFTEKSKKMVTIMIILYLLILSSKHAAATTAPIISQ